jgi:hypothetical protein
VDDTIKKLEQAARQAPLARSCATKGAHDCSRRRYDGAGFTLSLVSQSFFGFFPDSFGPFVKKANKTPHYRLFSPDQFRAQLLIKSQRCSPVTTISVSWLPQREQTSRLCQSGTGVSGPYRRAISAGSGST